jgi:outer membrane receptor protein involved in Fe transport
VSVIIGGRYQDVLARTRSTPNLTSSFESRDQTAVGTANLLVRATSGLNLIASAGRGFRSPNLVERFFDGPTPEGSGFQKRNLDLNPETSLNVDLGARWRRGVLFAEGFVFQNSVHDGIAIEATGDTVNRLPAFQNVNVDRLRFRGLELTAGARAFAMFDLSANFSRIQSKNVSDPNSPVGDTYSRKAVFDAAWRPVGNRLSLGYTLRHNGEQRDIVAGASPVGSVLPAFTVQDVRAQAALFDHGRNRTSLVLGINNLTNELYAEFANASFFRPEPRRSLITSLVVEF